MLNLKLENLAKINPQHGLSETELTKEASLIPDYLSNIHKRNQGFYKVIDDNKVIKEINEYAKHIEGKYEDIVVCGIGGSSLGSICLKQSLKHLYEDSKNQRTHPRLHVLDNIDPILIKETEDIIDLSKTLFIIITKSGGTPETLSEYFYFRKQCESKNLEIQKHFIFVTDPKNGLLRKISNDEGIKAFDVPENVGGRFSVLTAVGLLPAKLIGIDIEKMIKGAKTMRDKFLSENFEENLPFQIAATQYLLGNKGKIMNVLIPYSQKLIRFADWYRQLLAESIGKKLNDKNEVVHTGLTPINALGVTDQHSQSQLYNEGPNDKFFMFIEVEDHGADMDIPNPYPEEESVAYINNISFAKLLKTEKEGTEEALTQNDRPNITIKIPNTSEESLGALFLLFEGATAFLGEFYGINAFDQPGVELSKNLTKELLFKESI